MAVVEPIKTEKLPIFLYNIKNQKLLKSNLVTSNSYYFYGFQLFNAKIISGDAVLYSVKQISGSLDIQSGQEFTNNYGYTLYIPNNNTTVKIQIYDAETSIEYEFTLELTNIINEENEHYLDLLVNNNLPDFEQLKLALLDDFDNSDLIKRLLLDFKDIIRYKGTKSSIINFFKFLGYNGTGLTINDEFYNKKTNSVTISPDRLVDTKTGNYHVLYDNYNETGYDNNNLPVREIVIQNLETFFEKLKYTIALANTYFTLKEQNITFFGLNYSSNIANEPSITSYACANFVNDVNHFRKKLKINLWTHIDSVNKEEKIVNCLLKSTDLIKSEVKYYKENPIDFGANRNLFYIDNEIFDDLGFSNLDPEKIKRVFGVIVHLKIESPKTYVEFEFTDKINLVNTLKFEKTFINDFKYLQFVILNITNYKLKIKITDTYNNVEEYFYDFNIGNNLNRIDFDSFNSSMLTESNNNLSIDIDSPSALGNSPSPGAKTYVLPQDLIPQDLSQYYQTPLSVFKKWLTETEGYLLPEINQNFVLDIVTESIPLQFIDSWLHVIGIKYRPGYTLKLKIFDGSIGTWRLINYSDIGNYSKILDMLYIAVTDVIDTVSLETEQYYFITTTELGINICKELYDFVLVNNSNGNEISIYDELESSKKIPVNYDFPLFSLTSILNIPTYISPTEKQVTVEGNEYPLIESIFPKLIITSSDLKDTYYLNIGDIITCRLNENYIVNERNLSWKIYNAFNNEILYESNDLMLKYRIKENTIYSIICDFTINEQKYQIIKKSVFSSFK